jgi:hypothetical protein
MDPQESNLSWTCGSQAQDSWLANVVTSDTTLNLVKNTGNCNQQWSYIDNVSKLNPSEEQIEGLGNEVFFFLKPPLIQLKTLSISFPLFKYSFCCLPSTVAKKNLWFCCIVRNIICIAEVATTLSTRIFVELSYNFNS